MTTRAGIKRRQARGSRGAGVKLISGALKKIRNGEKGFTMVELLIVMVVSVILIAGMVGLIEMAMGQLTRSRALTTVTDSARRALTSMDRQIKQALQFDDAQCSSSVISFWADVDADDPDADVEHYANAEKVRFYLGAGNKLINEITQPAADGGAVAYNTLCSYVTAAGFYYFAQGVAPVYNVGSGTYTNGIAANYNESTGMVKAVITFQRARINRKFEQDIFLRILDRVND